MKRKEKEIYGTFFLLGDPASFCFIHIRRPPIVLFSNNLRRVPLFQIDGPRFEMHITRSRRPPIYGP